MIRTRALALLAALAFAAPAAADDAVPVTPPAPAWPAPVVRRLDNGLTVAVFRRPRLPIVQIQLALPAGVADEDSTQLGAAPLTASMLRAGTTSRTSEQFQADLDQLGAVFATSVTRDYALVSCGLLASDFENGLELFSDAVINPVFPTDEFELARRAAARQLGQTHTSPGVLAEERAWRVLFDPHPYARPLGGSLGRLLALSRDQLRAFHGAHWRPDRAVLAIAGDVEPERAFASAQEWFGRWAGRSEAPAPAAPTAPLAGHIVIVDVPGSPRTEIRMVQRGPGRRSEASGTSALLAEALDGTPSWPAGVHLTWSGAAEAGVLSASAGAPVESTATVVRRMLAAWKSVATSPPPAEAIAEALALQRSRLPVSLETLGSLAGTWQVGRLAGLADDHLATAAERLAKSASPAAVEEGARAFAATPTVIVTGPAESLREPLSALGTVEVQPFDLEANAMTEAGRPKATPEQLARGAELLAATLRAHGGTAALDAVKAISIEGVMLIHSGDRDVNGAFEQLRVEPYRLSYTMKLLDFESRQVLVRDRAWSVSGSEPPQAVDLDSAGVAGLRAVFDSDLLHALRFARGDSAAPAWQGVDEGDGRKLERLEFTVPAGGRARLLIDPDTHRVAAIETAPSPDGVWHERRNFSDYRQAGALWLPYREERKVDGTVLNSFKLRSILVNPKVDEKLFLKPGQRE